jgi:saccharopine dehydrogenase-like NADP-dependent oxidoreductase
MVTASYISPEMESLNSAAISAGILILNEIGLDPGLDHLAAMKVIEECKERGEVIETFESWCGGLPAPETATSNPFKYKFSWSPRGVLLAAQNSAKYLDNGEIKEIPGKDLLKSAREVTNIHPILMFEGIPNRDSLKYKKLYGLTDAKTMFRGTLRYKVKSKIIDYLVR